MFDSDETGSIILPLIKIMNVSLTNSGQRDSVCSRYAKQIQSDNNNYVASTRNYYIKVTTNRTDIFSEFSQGWYRCKETTNS